MRLVPEEIPNPGWNWNKSIKRCRNTHPPAKSVTSQNTLAEKLRVLPRLPRAIDRPFARRLANFTNCGTFSNVFSNFEAYFSAAETSRYRVYVYLIDNPKGFLPKRNCSCLNLHSILKGAWLFYVFDLFKIS